MSLKDFFQEVNLASQSPARLALLQKEGLTVNVFPQDCLEETLETHPGKVVESLSILKLNAFLKSDDFKENIPAIACDTLLWFENKLIGKAHSKEEAWNQISELSGKTHQVYSGYALYFKGKIFHGYDSADVTFTPISQEKLQAYVNSEEWKGAAGSYHIYGKAVDFIEDISGDPATVIGLPLFRINAVLENEVAALDNFKEGAIFESCLKD